MFDDQKQSGSIFPKPSGCGASTGDFCGCELIRGLSSLVSAADYNNNGPRPAHRIYTKYM